MKTPLVGSHIGLVSDVSADGVTYIDTGGYFGGGTLTLAQIFAIWAAGTTGAYMTRILGGQEDIQNLGTLGAAPTVDLNNANVFLGVLDQDCTVSFTGWPVRSATIRCSFTEDGTGGWTPTLSGVTWIGGTPTWDTTAGTTTHVVLFSDDSGVTIWGGISGSGGMDTSLVVVPSSGTTETIDVSVARTYKITLDNNCTFTLSGAVAAEAWFATLVVEQDGTGSRLATWPGSVVWPGGVTPTLSTDPAAVDVFTLFTLDGGTVWFGFPTGGGASETSGHYELLMAAGITSPPEPLENGAGDDWLYVWVP